MNGNTNIIIYGAPPEKEKEIRSGFDWGKILATSPAFKRFELNPDIFEFYNNGQHKADVSAYGLKISVHPGELFPKVIEELERTLKDYYHADCRISKDQTFLDIRVYWGFSELEPIYGFSEGENVLPDNKKCEVKEDPSTVNHETIDTSAENADTATEHIAFSVVNDDESCVNVLKYKRQIRKWKSGNFTNTLAFIKSCPKHASLKNVGDCTSYFDVSLNQWSLQVRLDGEGIWFLSVFVKADGTFGEYSLDKELADDSHYGFCDEKGIRRSLYKLGDNRRDFAEILIRYVRKNGGEGLLKAIQPFITSQHHYY